MLITIADIHGRADLLKALLKKLIDEWTLDLTRDKLVFLGDYIDRGPDSRGVIDTIWGLTKNYPDNVIALVGNHEDMCIKAYKEIAAIGRRLGGNALNLWMINGGVATESSWPRQVVPAHVIEWLDTLPESHSEPGFFFSHAPAPCEEIRSNNRKGTPLTRNELIWTFEGEDEWRYARNLLPATVGVCGHIHALFRGIMTPRFYDHYIFADAGCGCHHDAPLFAIDVEKRTSLSVYPNNNN